MVDEMLLWSQFLGCTVIIAIAGSQLSRYGEIIGQLTGLGGTWIGLLLLATVTSLPELATGISAVAVLKQPDLAIGDAQGSCVFNLGLLAVLNWLYRGKSIYYDASPHHLLSAGWSVVLIATAGIALLLPKQAGHWSLGHVGWYSPVIVLLYLIAMRAMYRQERQSASVVNANAHLNSTLSLRQAFSRYVITASVVVMTGYSLAWLGERLVGFYGWHASFVGTLFIAGGTSLPELVVTVAALRLGALDMAIANLLGSNLFNMLILAIDDLFYLPGPILADAALQHVISSFSALIMTGIFMLALRGRAEHRSSLVSTLLLAVYLLNAGLMFGCYP